MEFRSQFLTLLADGIQQCCDAFDRAEKASEERCREEFEEKLRELTASRRKKFEALKVERALRGETDEGQCFGVDVSFYNGFEIAHFRIWQEQKVNLEKKLQEVRLQILTEYFDRPIGKEELEVVHNFSSDWNDYVLERVSEAETDNAGNLEYLTGQFRFLDEMDSDKQKFERRCYRQFSVTRAPEILGHHSIITYELERPVNRIEDLFL